VPPHDIATNLTHKPINRAKFVAQKQLLSAFLSVVSTDSDYQPEQHQSLEAAYKGALMYQY
jgi:hypothetical protein